MVAVFAADYLGGINDLILSSDTTLDDAGGEENPVSGSGTLHLVEGAGHFVRLEGDTLSTAASCAKWAVKTIFFAARGHNCIENCLFTRGGANFRNARASIVPVR